MASWPKGFEYCSVNSPLAELHRLWMIVHSGISYMAHIPTLLGIGFVWICLVWHLSTRSGHNPLALRGASQNSEPTIVETGCIILFTGMHHPWLHNVQATQANTS